MTPENAERLKAVRLEHLEAIAAMARNVLDHAGLQGLVKNMDCALAVTQATIVAEEAIERVKTLTEHQKLLDQIIHWAEDNPKFDVSFIKRLRLDCELKPLTDNQVAAVENIVEKWRMELDDY